MVITVLFNYQDNTFHLLHIMYNNNTFDIRITELHIKAYFIQRECRIGFINILILPFFPQKRNKSLPSDFSKLKTSFVFFSLTLELVSTKQHDV